MAPCTIRWCGNRSDTSNFEKDGITFHRYPKDPALKEKWINATRRDNWFPGKFSVICSRHFEKDCFIGIKNGRRRLLSSSVPKLFLPMLTNTVDSDTAEPCTSKGSITHKDQSDFNKKPPEILRKRKILEKEDPYNYDTIAKRHLCRRIIELTDKVVRKNRQIKNLRQKVFYLQKVIANLKSATKEKENKK